MLSEKLNRDFQSLAVAESQIRRTRFVYRGEPVRKRDLARVRGIFTLWLALWHETLSASRFEKAYSIKRWLSAISTNDVFDLLSECKAADELLLEALETGLCYDYDSFKHCLKREIGKSIVLIGMLKGLIAAWFESMDHTLLRALRTLLLYPTQLTLKSDKLQEEALEDYLSNEERLAIPIVPTSLEKQVLERWFPRSLEETFYACMEPHHGNGAVAEEFQLTLSDKDRLHRTDARLSYLAKRVPGVAWHPTGGTLRRVARVAFVPKSYKSYRTISMEPASLMWWQEGINASFVRLLRAGAFGSFGRRYDPRREDLSRELARRGSLDGSYATIDLHAASDSVRWSLVKEWFRNTCLFTALFCTRSYAAELPDDSGCCLRLNKFAPMGSAVNFMVECAVFAAITEAAILESGGDPERSSYRVFGDDIVVETRYAPAVISRLTSNGFIVNQTKTFQYGALGYFREACGGHYADGVDVTPVRASKFFEDYRLDFWKNPATYFQVIDQCNQFHRNGYRLARGVLIHRLLELPQRYRPLFVSEDSETTGVLSRAPVNDHIPAEFDMNLQEWVYKHGAVRPVTGKNVSLDPSTFCYEWLRRTLDRSKVDEPCHVDYPDKISHAKLVSSSTPAFVAIPGREDLPSLPSLNACDLPGWQGTGAS